MCTTTPTPPPPPHTIPPTHTQISTYFFKYQGDTLFQVDHTLSQLCNCCIEIDKLTLLLFSYMYIISYFHLYTHSLYPAVHILTIYIVHCIPFIQQYIFLPYTLYNGETECDGKYFGKNCCNCLFFVGYGTISD